ncbi:MAG: DNA-binding protein [Sporomusa sp.]|jgi:transcriptional regulator with XRE-family HTH domain|nr:DNA-binding protein [Sporomusa sp.]
MDKPQYAVRLAKLRNNKGLTQQQVADITGLTRARLNNYEQGVREPDYDTLLRLADFFGVTTDHLLGRTDIKNNPVTIAASRSDDRMDDLPEQALKEIEQFKEFVRTKYAKK